MFELNLAGQTQQVTGIDKPNGAWKVEPNGTHMVAADGRQAFIEYAAPSSVPALMAEIIDFTNAVCVDDVSAATAHEYYSKIHMGIAHVHPFWDGNGRIARLLANIPLLKAGLPPLTIPDHKRRAYLQLLADYQVTIGQLDASTFVCPAESLLAAVSHFCKLCFRAIRHLFACSFVVPINRSCFLANTLSWFNIM